MNTQNQLIRAASFAADRHRDQRRKGENGAPYINHPLEVANMLANIGGIEDTEVLIAAILHDTVEDCGVRPEELRAHFGDRITDLVLEVTDDKSLPKPERKRLQVEHAPHLSPEAKAIKLADKISNVTDVAHDPPSHWPIERQQEYIRWASSVVAGFRGVNEPLEKLFDERVKLAREKLFSPPE